MFKLEGHSAPLVDVQFMSGTPQIITADIDGWIKIWDARNFHLVQTILALPEVQGMGDERLRKGEMTGFAVCGGIHRRLVVPDHRSLICYDQEGGLYKKVVEHNQIASLLYNPVTLTFATACDKEVKVWNAISGKLSKVYRELTETELTALCFDGRNRKLITGDHQGHVRVYNYLTGAFMKSMEQHEAEVVALEYCSFMHTVISVGRDRIVRCSDERPIEDKVVIYEIEIPSDVTCVAVSCETGCSLAVGDSEGYMNMFELELGRR
eukprot:8521_1